MIPENDSQQLPLVQCDHCGGDATRQDGEVLRCECGSLLARYVAGRIELKCRRCKRTVTVSAESMEMETITGSR